MTNFIPDSLETPYGNQFVYIYNYTPVEGVEAFKKVNFVELLDQQDLVWQIRGAIVEDNRESITVMIHKSNTRIIIPIKSIIGVFSRPNLESPTPFPYDFRLNKM